MSCWDETRGTLERINEILPVYHNAGPWQEFIVSIDVHQYTGNRVLEANLAIAAINANEANLYGYQAYKDYPALGGFPIWYRIIDAANHAHAALIVPRGVVPENAATFRQRSRIYARIEASENFDLVVFSSKDSAAPGEDGLRSVGFGEFRAFMAVGGHRSSFEIKGNGITIDVFP